MSHPILLMGAALMPAFSAREVLVAIEVSPAFMHRARQLRRICNHYTLDTIESPILGEVVYVDAEFGSPLYGWRDIHWSWEATGDSQRWRISGYMGPDGDQDFVTLAVTDFVEVAMLTKLVRSKRPYLYTGSGSDPDLGTLDRNSEGWRRFAALDFTLPEPFGYLGPG